MKIVGVSKPYNNTTNYHNKIKRNCLIPINFLHSFKLIPDLTGENSKKKMLIALKNPGGLYLSGSGNNSCKN